jgi:hypothetical protein
MSLVSPVNPSREEAIGKNFDDKLVRDFICKASRQLEMPLCLDEQRLSTSNAKSNRTQETKTLLDLKGLVIYSSKNTLCSNPVLFFGINPGIPPSLEHEICWTMRQSLRYFSNGYDVLKYDSSAKKAEYNLIDDQCWPRPPLYQKPDYPPGDAPYQRRVRYLLHEIGHPNALVTNLIFLQSRSLRTLHSALPPPERKKLLNVCWSVHEEIFKICDPNIVITCPAVIKEFLRQKFGLWSVETFPARHVLNGDGRDWQCQVWEGEWNKRSLTVITMPHMSIYDITNPSRRPTMEKIKEIVSKRMNRRGN